MGDKPHTSVRHPREAEEGTGLRGGKAAGVNGVRGHPPHQESKVWKEEKTQK